MHTRLRWRAEGLDIGDPMIVAGKNGVYIARVFTQGLGYEGPANARLIAAAPQLLAVVQAFLRAPSDGSRGPASSTLIVQDFNLRDAHAAIAAATGKG